MKTLKKLAFFIHTMGRGGAEKALVNLLNNLPRNQYKITLYILINTGELIHDVPEDIEIISLINLPERFLNKNSTETGTLIKGNKKGLSIPAKIYGFIWRYFSNILFLFLKRKIGDHDLYISFLEGPTNKLVSKIKTDSAKIAWVHVDLSVEKKSELFFRSMEENRNHYAMFDHLVAVSDDVKKSLENYIEVNNSVSVLHNVYEIDEIISKSKEPLSQEETKYFSQEKINCISVGRLANQKGYDRLLEAINYLKKNDKKVLELFQINIVGDGEEYSNLLSKVEEYELSDVVRFVGFNANPYKLMKNSDVFISSSRTEGFSTVVVESVILGIPIYTTNCSGMEEILEGVPDSKLFENSTMGIVEMFIELHQSSKKGSLQHFSVDKFSIEKTIDSHIRLFEGVLNEKKC